MEKIIQALSTKEIEINTTTIGQIKSEIVRKMIHFLIALVPLLANINMYFALLLLTSGIIFYIIVESLRNRGLTVLLVSNITAFASRERDKGKFVLGPVTLGIGAMCALLIYPEPASRIAIYALAFGDGFASLMGKLVGGFKIPFTRGKTFIGSFSCFCAVYIITLRILGNPILAFWIAIMATLLEVLPTNDFDNLLIPMGTGLFAAALIGII